MFVDTSAILAGEPDADRFLDRLAGDGETTTAPRARLGSGMIQARALGLEDAIGRGAVRAFSCFGKGRGHPAKLNFGDCLSPACVAERGSTILFEGVDFVHTDLEAALA